MPDIIVYSHKGGVGTSVVAAALAVMSSADRETVLFDTTDSQFSVLGCPRVAGYAALTDGLTLVNGDRARVPETTARTYRMIADYGKVDPSEPDDMPADAVKVLVVRNCYLSLARATVAVIRPDWVVVVTEANRALHPDDVAAVLDAPLVTVPATPAVARTVDAGLLVARIPKDLEPLRQLL